MTPINAHSPNKPLMRIEVNVFGPLKEQATYIKWYESKLVPVIGMLLHDAALNKTPDRGHSARITEVNIAPYDDAYHVYLEMQYVTEFEVAQNGYGVHGWKLKSSGSFSV